MHQGRVVSVKFITTRRTDTSEKRMVVQCLQLFLLSVARGFVRNQFVTVPRIARWCPCFLWFSVGVWSEVEAAISLNATGIHGADNVRVVGVQETAIAFWNLGHDVTKALIKGKHQGGTMVKISTNAARVLL